MSRILLVDDSPHAQRMGERILSDEGYEVVTVSNSDSALIRLDDVDPDVVLADTVMPGRTGFEICQYLKMSPRHRHVRVILTAGVLEPLDDAQVQRAEADGTLRKPFEASALIAAVKPLAEAAAAARTEAANQGQQVKGRPGGQGIGPIVPFVAVVDAEQVRAAVTVALDASMGTIVDEIAGRVLAALNTRKSSGSPPEAAPARTEPPTPAAPPPRVLSLPPARVEPVRRVTPLKIRTTSILGLELDPTEPEDPASEPRTLRPATRSEFTRPAFENRSGFASPSQPPGPRPTPDAVSPRPPTLTRFGERPRFNESGPQRLTLGPGSTSGAGRAPRDLQTPPPEAPSASQSLTEELSPSSELSRFGEPSPSSEPDPQPAIRPQPPD